METKTGYRVAYYSLFDTQPIEFSEEFKKNHHLLEPYKNQKVVKQLIKIAAGWYYLEEVNGHLYFYDIRFGQSGVEHDSPFFWKYELIEDSNGIISAKQSRPQMGDMGSVLGKLYERMLGN